MGAFLLIQPQSFSKEVSGWMLLYVSHVLECSQKDKI